MRARGESRRTCRRVRLFVSRVVLDQCCNSDLGYLLLQINVICLLPALIGATAIAKHSAWFGGTAVASQSLAER